MLNQTIVQTYENYKDYNVNNQLTFLSWIDLIKNGNHDYINYIQSARKVGKGNNEYDLLKSQIPVCSLNFIFGVKRENKEVLRPTGLLYIDIDDSKFNINTIDKNLIHAYWKSFGGNGYSIVVRVNGLTIDNFHSSYENIISLLGITDDYDKGAKSATQANVLSYDPNLFYNRDSYIFSCVSDDGKKVSNGITKKKKEGFTPNSTFFPNENIRFNNIEDFFTGDNENKKYVILEDDNQMIATVFLPRFVEEGKRNISMFNYGCQIMALNPGLNHNRFNGFMNYGNSKLISPLNENELKSICHSIWKKYLSGNIEVYFNKKRRIIFNPKYKLSGTDRVKLSNKILGKLKSDNTKQKIYECIESWDFSNEIKITIKGVARRLNVHESTVKRYWRDFKDYAHEINVSNNVLCEKTLKKHLEKEIQLDYKLNDEVDVVEFLKQLFIHSNEKIDTSFIVEFKFAINTSRASVEDILKRLIEIIRDKRCLNSSYRNINIPPSIINTLSENKLKLVA